jgi:hypothetical protein
MTEPNDALRKWLKAREAARRLREELERRWLARATAAPLNKMNGTKKPPAR